MFIRYVRSGVVVSAAVELMNGESWCLAEGAEGVLITT